MTLEYLEANAFKHLRTQYPSVVNTLKKFSAVKYDAEKGTYQWIFEYDLKRGKPDLLRLLENNKDTHGFILGDLLESYPGDLPAAVEELEHSGEILLIRANEKKKWKIYHTDSALKHEVDKDFKELWELLVVPEDATGFETELAAAGLKIQTAEKEKTGDNDGKKKKSNRGKRIKIVNTHLADLGIDLTKDYVWQK